MNLIQKSLRKEISKNFHKMERFQLFWRLKILPSNIKKASSLAYKYFQRGKSHSEKATNSNSEFLKALRAFEMSILLSHNSDSASESLEAAISLIEKRPSKEAFCELGEICFSKGFYYEAHKITDKVLQMNKNYADAYYLRSICNIYRYREEKEELKIINKKLLELAKEDLTKAKSIYTAEMYSSAKWELFGQVTKEQEQLYLIEERLDFSKYGGQRFKSEPNKSPKKELEKRVKNTTYQLDYVNSELEEIS